VAEGFVDEVSLMDADEQEKMLNIMFALNQWIVGEPFADKDGKLSRSRSKFWERWYSPPDDPNRFTPTKVLTGGRVEPTYQVKNPKYSPLNSRSGYQMIPWNIESLDYRFRGTYGQPSPSPMPDWFYLLDHPSWGKVLIVSVLAGMGNPKYSDPFMVWFYEDGPNQQFVQVWDEEMFQMDMLEDEEAKEWLMEGKLYMITDWREPTDQMLLNWTEVPETLLS
jgi:hypothetical protein